MNLDSPVPFAVLVAGPYIKIVENPSKTAYMPFWLQELLQNDALRLAVPTPPRGTYDRLASVVSIEALRSAKEARLAGEVNAGM
jgi:hypothetical protein